MGLSSSTPATIKFTVGVPGSGKSYTRVRWILEEFIPNQDGILYTNLPLNVSEIVRYFKKKNYSAKVIKKRLVVIPDDVQKKWKQIQKNGMPIANVDYVKHDDGVDVESLEYHEKQYEYQGPWVYFQDKEVEGSHILLDEIQKVVHTRSPRDAKSLWGDWLSTIRHCGATIEFMTQRERRVPPEIKEIAETRLDIVPNKGHRLKYLPILNYDYYQLVKGLFDLDLNSSNVYESSASAGGRLKSEHSKKYRFDPFYFKFYNTTGESSKKDTRKKEEWEKYSKYGLIKWFLSRNFPQCILACIYAYVIYFICFSGGFLQFQKFIQNRVGGNANSIEYKAKKKGMSVEQYRTFTITENVKAELKKEQAQKVIEDEENKKRIEATYQKDIAALRIQILSLKADIKGKRISQKNEPIVDEKLKIETEKLIEERLKNKYNIVFLPSAENYALLKNGLKIKVGHAFKTGPYEGQTIKKISFDERCVYLTNDEVLYFD
jgi:hypothetical protein